MKLNNKLFLTLLFAATLAFANTDKTDSDGDGVIDFRDNCLDTPVGYYIDADGCETFCIMHPDFLKERINVTAQTQKELETLIEFLDNRPQIKLRIVGHSSRTKVSGDAYNMKLSIKRAKMLEKELLKRGVSPKKIETLGKGFHEPMFSNETKEGREKNRRLEIDFIEID